MLMRACNGNVKWVEDRYSCNWCKTNVRTWGPRCFISESTTQIALNKNSTIWRRNSRKKQWVVSEVQFRLFYEGDHGVGWERLNFETLVLIKDRDSIFTICREIRWLKPVTTNIERKTKETNPWGLRRKCNVFESCVWHFFERTGCRCTEKFDILMELRNFHWISKTFKLRDLTNSFDVIRNCNLNSSYVHTRWLWWSKKIIPSTL